MPSIIAMLLPHRLAEDRTAALANLVDELRSGKGVPPDLAVLLADMLDETGSSEWRLDLRRRGKRGPAPKPMSPAMRAAGDYLYEMIDERGEKFEGAVAKAAAHFEISASSAKSALRKRREEQALLDEVEAETGERPDFVFTR